MSIRKIFEEDLASLKTELINMCRLVEDMIDNAALSFQEHNVELGKHINEVDKTVDEYEMNIEKKCMRLLLKQQPVAKDFREVSTALKIITDLERIGDQASDIGELVASFPSKEYFTQLDDIIRMCKHAKLMVHESFDSFIQNDESLAEKVVKDDDIMDELFVKTRTELIEYLKQDSSIADQAICFMMIAKYLERIGDHAVNVCEWTKYLETGVHTKY